MRRERATRTVLATFGFVALPACTGPAASVNLASARDSSLELGGGTCAIRERGAPPAPFEDFARLRDPARLMAWHDQEEHSARYAAEPAPDQPFPAVPYTRVRAFAFRFAGGPMLESALPGCVDHVLSQEGQLCPSVVADGLEPSPSQLARLIAAANLPKAKVALGCIFDPHHAFVFYDANHAPVTDIRVCFNCGQWSIADASPVTMPDGAFSVLASLCTELGLGGCPTTAEGDQASANSLHTWLDSGAPPRPSKVFGIPPERKLNEMTATERRQLCTWRAVELAAIVDDDQDLGRDLNPEKSFWKRSLHECVARFPKCSKTLGEVEQTDFRTDKLGLRFLAPQHCVVSWVFGSLGKCLWGIDRP